MNFKATNLSGLLGEYRVEIPMLQRDYAQGRVSQTKIASQFLDSIFDALRGDTKTLHIDFIYGYRDGGNFLLIDGQQRITTLWLLHFYLYRKIDALNEIKGLLEKFSYKTRKSSKKFCQNLLKKDFDLDKKPSEAIRDRGGEFETKENLDSDPTIKAMLHMLDLIFERAEGDNDPKRLVQNLGKITFDLFDMQEFGLGEELYIKMNARGKQLSKYENLKSFIEKDPVISKDKELLISIDTTWSDYFFDSKEIQSFDVRGCNFLHYATLFFTLEQQKKIDLKEIVANPNGPVNEFYEPLQNIENLKVLDRVIGLCMRFDDLGASESLKLKNSSFFDKLPYPDICYFFSVLFFVRENVREDIDENALDDYLRVCRHFTENHLLDSLDHIKSFFDLFKHLSQGCGNVYSFLETHPEHSFHSNIYRLEVRKAKLILQSRGGGENWETILNRTSKHEVLKGWIDFLLDFSDEDFEYEKYNKTSEKPNLGKLEKPNLEKFEKYAELTMQILDKEHFLDRHLTLFKRAFLCVGDYGFYARNYFYGNSPMDLFRDREALNWLLRGNKNNAKLPYFQKFLDALLESQEKDLKRKMEELIEQTDLSQKKWWEQLLIGEVELFDDHNKKEKFQRYPRIRRFDHEEVNKFELLPGSRNVTSVKDMLGYGFYCYCKRRGLPISEYECSEKEYGAESKISPYFSLHGEQVWCGSMQSIIKWGNKEYSIRLQEGNHIFDEFDGVLRQIECDKS